ncbi:type IV toxin-antitoxin system YeeU family antitoxin [Escherichia coli]|nr:type IV toxin-antitoxin system YeeU family antitoxin [Escherichia coli]EZQ52948.1 hypothetical protein AF56_04703 [Escherichia coli BIDMC 83]EFH4835395.1 type IV toxin-antitoxin system YeeU family antitoxin [Escherichia coli]EFH5992701.1 type IV toxin-antitoxin system YeeU family antitoxin [Escherichia coli]EFM0279498.1 type IV toxin-antitoxin system YeeU family antitoxin [Escherichia coli]
MISLPLWWRLRCNITSCFAARLVPEGNRPHYMTDRASITDIFGGTEYLKLEEAFPHFIRQIELLLSTGELKASHAHCVTLYHNAFTCEADTLGSCGYVYIVIIPLNVKLFSLARKNVTTQRAAKPCPSPVTVWQMLLTTLWPYPE